MHLTTSRIGTLEPFSVFFILLMYIFMIAYIQQDFMQTPFLKHLRKLLYCGIAMGLAIATKWTGCYSAVGLAILLFGYWICNILKYRKQDCSAVFYRKLICTILCCFLFFIILPVLIYALSYLPDRVWKGESWSFGNVCKQVLAMYEYHATLNASHPYSSTWIQWIFDIRPIWYYFHTGANHVSYSISCFSNPLLTLLGLPSIFFVLYEFLFHQNQKAWVILVGYLSALVPWMIITRCVFAYHFYPTSLFMILAIVFVIQKIVDAGPAYRHFVIALLGLYVMIFLLFLPVTAGSGTSLSYIRKLEWLSTWYFGAPR